MIEQPGAVPVEAVDPASRDAGVAAHYGDPLREQRLIATDAALIDRSNRGVLAVPGPERAGWLHSLTTQHLTDLKRDEGTELLVLSPHGHVEQHAMVAEDGETTWLDVEPWSAGELLAFLEKMRFLTRVEPRDATADFALLTLAGPGAVEVAGGLREPDAIAVPGPKFAAGSVPSRPTIVYPVRQLDSGGWARRTRLGVDLLVPRAAVASVVSELGVPLAGLWAFEALRVASRVPRLGFETDHRTIPAEVEWPRSAVHLDKGCYRGQETVARVHNLGRPPRRLVLLHLDGVTTDRLPPPGTPVHTAEGRAVGFVGTAVQHFELGPVALALIKRNVADDAELRVGESAAAIDLE